MKCKLSLYTAALLAILNCSACNEDTDSKETPKDCTGTETKCIIENDQAVVYSCVNHEWAKADIQCVSCNEDNTGCTPENEQGDPECTENDSKCVADGSSIEMYKCLSGSWSKLDTACSACDADGKECAPVEEPTPQDKNCTENETKCESADGSSSLYTCKGGSWSKSTEVCAKCSADGKTCEAAEEPGPQDKDCTENETKCESAEGTSSFYTCKGGSWSKSTEVCAKCSADGKTCEAAEEPGPQDKDCTENETKCESAEGTSSLYSCKDGSWSKSTQECAKCSADGKSCIGEDTDENGNHMRDIYETASNQGQNCRKYKDCDSSEGAGDGFCDSVIGYKCSTRCTDDSQCMNGFICRTKGDHRCAAESYVSVWTVLADNAVINANDGNSNGVKYTIDWGDGSKAETITSTKSTKHKHVFTKTGDYTITVTGSDLYDWGGLTVNDSNKISIAQIKSFGTAKAVGAPKMQTSDIPDAVHLTNLDGMFSAKGFNDPVEHWDVSNVTSMEYTFSMAAAFNQPLNHWDTSKVKSMRLMFSEAKAFNQPIDEWDVSNVTCMSEMFADNKVFNQPLNSWDVSKVSALGRLFYNAESFNQPLDQWNTSNFTDIEELFKNAKTFDQDLSSWKLSKVKFMLDTFKGSALSKENYCKMMSAGWKGKSAGEMGMSEKCSK